jgi:hypothetical protein
VLLADSAREERGKELVPFDPVVQGSDQPLDRLPFPAHSKSVGGASSFAVIGSM